MPRRLQLAAEEPEGLLNHTTSVIDEFLCRALKGESASWTTLEGQVSPDELLQRCCHHGVAALLFQNLRERSGFAGWPEPVRAGLERLAAAGVAQELLRARHLGRLLRDLSHRGIPCLLTKGEALARTLYDTPGIRSRSDSDVFIPVAAITDVTKSIEKLGYRIVSPVYKSRQFTVMRTGDPSANVRFDIHWRILNAPRYARLLSFEEAYQRSVTVPGLPDARALCHTDALLLACVHRFGNARHDRNRLIWLYDIEALARALGESALSRFATIAIEKGVQGECLDGLRHARECFGVAIPEDLEARLGCPGPPEPWIRRLGRSRPGLLVADWNELPGSAARTGLIRELFLPPARGLLDRYQKTSRLWLPVLYLRRMLGGLFGRLTLR